MKKKPVDLLVVIGAFIVVLIGGIYFVLLMTGLSFSQMSRITPQAMVTVLPASIIPTVDNSFLIIAPTPTKNPVLEGEGEFGVESYVQITGTGGNGLRLRASPGTTAEVNFIAAELEVFRVIGGPVQAGDYTWWQLIAPYDANRQGWAAGDFLRVIEQ